MKYYLIFIVFSIGLLFGNNTLSENKFSKKIVDSLLINNYQDAIAFCKAALIVYPDSIELQKLLLRSLAANGDSNESLVLFNNKLKDRNLIDNFSIIEDISWGFLSQNKDHSQMTKLSALIGVYLTKDVKGISLLVDGMKSSNAFLRYLSVQFASHYNDKILQDEIIDLFKREKNWLVKRQLIESIGAMRLKSGKKYLQSIIESRSTDRDEKATAILSLIQINDDITKEEIDTLLKDKSSGLRQLGIAFIDHFNKIDLLEKIIPLLHDNSPSVIMRALSVLGTFDISGPALSKVEDSVIKLTKELNSEIAIMAAWVTLKFNQEIGRDELKKWVVSKDLQSARMAASFLGAGGTPTSVLAQEMFDKVDDSYVKANLAIGMIKQHSDIKKASEYLHKFVRGNSEKIMIKHGIYPMFNIIMPTNVRHNPAIPRYVDMVDQMTRLHIINMLCIIGDEDAKELVKEFLKDTTYDIASSAMIVILEECDFQAIDIVRELIDDKDEKIRMQAALVIAFYGRDPSVVGALESIYKNVDWDSKVSILEALGFIGSRESIPFLMNVMQEPFQSLRVVAASSIIQCLYH